MATKWISAAKGIRYREHATRMQAETGRYSNVPDRYYSLAYKLDGKTVTEGIGWHTDGWTLKKCENILLDLRQNWKSGKGARTYKEMRESNLEATEAEKKQEQHEQSLTLQAIFEGGYMAAQSTKGKSALKAEGQLMKNHITPYFGNTPLRDITPAKMDEFLQHLMQKQSVHGRPLSAATTRYILAVVRQIWNYALSRGLTDAPYPAKRVKAPTADNKRTRFLTRDEAERLLEALKVRSQTTHDMALLSLFCGLRAGELFKLQWADVNFQEGFIHIRDRKNKESGTAWMTPRVKEMLAGRFAERAESDFVFPSRSGDGKAFTSKLFSKVVDDLGLNASITDKRDKIVFHSLRHTFASWLAQKGVPLHSLAGLMGHKSTTMTQRYAHLAPDVQKSHAMLIDDAPPQQGNVLPFERRRAEG